LREAAVFFFGEQELAKVRATMPAVRDAVIFLSSLFITDL
jgi:hypothetical protein